MTSNKSHITLERFIQYLKGAFSAHERHAFEKELMQDHFESDAYDGLSKLSGEELEKEMLLLLTQLSMAAGANKRALPVRRYAMAASWVLLAGIAAGLFWLWYQPLTTNQLAINSIKEKKLVEKRKIENTSGKKAEASQNSEMQEKTVVSESGNGMGMVTIKEEDQNDIPVAKKEELKMEDIKADALEEKEVQQEPSPVMDYTSAKEVSQPVVDSIATIAEQTLSKNSRTTIAANDEQSTTDSDKKNYAISTQSGSRAKSKVRATYSAPAYASAPGTSMATYPDMPQLTRFMNNKRNSSQLQDSCKGLQVWFVITLTAEGKLQNIKIKNALENACTDEVKRLLNLYDAWKAPAEAMEYEGTYIYN